jgi:hypothetical protein
MTIRTSGTGDVAAGERHRGSPSHRPREHPAAGVHFMLSIAPALTVNKIGHRFAEGSRSREPDEGYLEKVAA